MIETESVSTSTTIAINPTNAILIAGDLEDWASEINSEHLAASDCAQTAIEHARRAGGLLIKAKQALPHGDWLPWLAANVHVSERSVQVYMKLARENPQHAAGLSMRRALAELAAPISKAHIDHEGILAIGRNRQKKMVNVAGPAPTPDKHGASPVPAPEPQQTSTVLDGRAAKPLDRNRVDAVNLDERWIPDEDEDARIEATEREIAASLDRAVSGDAQAEIRRQAAELAIVKLSRDGYMNERIAAIRLCKQRKREIDRLRAENNALRARVSAMEGSQS
jgi:hypothetical protein